MDTQLEPANGYDVKLNTKTLFLLSTSGSQSSIEKHNKALKTLGINLIYFTFAHEISPQTYANLFRSPIVRGGAVTGKGLKAGILPYLDELDELSKNIGAVNTVLNIDGKLHGYNTDAFGLETAFRQQFALSGNEVKKAVIYGNGGVSGVAAYVLKKMGVAVTMKGRNPEKVAEKMKSLGLESFDGPYDLAVSATPVSSEPLENAMGLMDILNESKMVFDHNMPEKDAKKNHIEEYCKTQNKYFIPGKEMYVPQMIKQWKLFLDGVSNDEKPISITEEEIIKTWELKV